jgi:hypothetical protein
MSQEKTIVVVGGRSETGKLVSALEVAYAYGVDPGICILASSEAMVRGMRTAGKTILRPWAANPLEVAHAGE